MIVILKFIIIHLIISLLVSLLLSRFEMKRFIVHILLTTFIPFLGVILVIIFSTVKVSEEGVKRIEEEEFEQAEPLFINVNLENKYNELVPIEELLLFNDDDLKRKNMLKYLKEDVFRYLESLKIALRDKDVETSHYASVAILKLRGELEYEIQKLEIEYEKDSGNLEIIKAYIEVLKKYLESGLIPKYSIDKYNYIYLNTLKKHLEKEESTDSYINIIEHLINMKNLNSALFYSKEFLEKNKCEESYMKILKCYYLIKDNKSFFKYFNELRNSKVNLSKKGLEKVRFWIEE